MAAPSKRIMVFGHSFVKRLWEFIRANSEDFSFHMRLYNEGPPLIQYTGLPGAITTSLRQHVDAIVDFEPNIVILVIGTNDIYDYSLTPQAAANRIMDFVDSLLQEYGVEQVILLQTLHRHQPTVHTRFPVDVVSYNQRVDEMNLYLDQNLSNRTNGHAYLWRLKGFWSPDCAIKNFARDGCHLTDAGNRRLYSNIRAAVVAALRGSI